MFKLTNKNTFIEEKRLTPGSYNLNVYIQKKSGPGILSLEFFINGIITEKKNVICKNSSCEKISFKLNSKSSIKVVLKSKYSGIAIIKKVDYISSEIETIIKQKRVGLILKNNEDLYKKYSKLLSVCDGHFYIDFLNIEPNRLEQSISNPNIKNFHCYNFTNLDNYLLNNNYDILITHDSVSVDAYLKRIGYNKTTICLSEGIYNGSEIDHIFKYNNDGSFNFNGDNFEIDKMQDVLSVVTRKNKIKLRERYPNEIIRRGCFV